MELRLDSNEGVVLLGTGEPPDPIPVAGALQPIHEGRLVQVSGSVARWAYNRWWLTVGNAQVEVYVRQSTGLRRPWLEEGMRQQVVGVATTWDESMRILPFDTAHIGIPTPQEARQATHKQRVPIHFTRYTVHLRFWQRYFAL